MVCLGFKPKAAAARLVQTNPLNYGRLPRYCLLFLVTQNLRRHMFCKALKTISGIAYQRQ